MNEIWRLVRHSKGMYKVSNFGRIKSVSRVVVRKRTGDKPLRGKILKTHTRNTKEKSRYPLVYIYRKTKFVHIRVHTLVAEVFVPNPDKKPWVNHKDGNKLNNHASNLEWVTPKENAEHAIGRGLFAVGSRKKIAKLNETKVAEIRRRLERGERVCDLHKQYEISQSVVSMIKNRYIWKHVK